MFIRKVSVIDAFGVLLENRDVGIKNGVFDTIAPHNPLASAEGYTEVINGESLVIIPGFVNAHTHVPMTLLRGYGEDMKLQSWLFDRIFPFEDKLTAEAVYYGSLLGIAEMISSGTVSFSDMYYFCDDIAKAADETGIKANIARGTSVPADCRDYYATQSHKDTLELLEKYAAHPRIKIDLAPHSEYTTNLKVLSQMADFAKTKKLGIQVHVSETHLEHYECVARHGMTPTGVMKSTGILDSPTTVAHGVWLTDSDMDILAESGSTVAHCPHSNLKLGSGIARLDAMKRRGVAVAIGTDSAASNNSLNMLEEMRTASLLAKGISCDPTSVPAQDALRMATLEGARAQGRDFSGDIKIGHSADFVAIDKNRISMIPHHNLLANIVFSAKCRNIVMTVINGKVLYKNGEFKTIDIARVKHMANKFAMDIAKAVKG